MLTLGDYNTLKIVKRVDFGLYLDGGDEGEVLMPKRYVTPQMQIVDEVQVFFYLDQDASLPPPRPHWPRWASSRGSKWPGPTSTGPS